MKRWILLEYWDNLLVGRKQTKSFKTKKDAERFAKQYGMTRLSVVREK